MSDTNKQELKILLVDDDEAIRDSLSMYLDSHGWEVITAASAQEGLDYVQKGIGDIIISDICMPGMDGLTFLKKIKELDSDAEVLIATGHSNEETVIEALRNGAFDYFRKPIDGAQLEQSLQRTRKVYELKSENRRLKALLARVATQNDMHSFIGVSPASKKLLGMIEKVSQAPMTTVTITGESGTGKEVAARMIHQLSKPNGPFIAVNCGGMAETLLESELFGHEKGSFTGADKRSAGVFEMAAGGTVLLDEISEMSMQAQSRFLRVLEDRRFYRVGGSKEVKLGDTRIITATNKNLKSLVDKGEFREDLYYRIQVATIHISPLRERREDILPLAYHFLERNSNEMNREFKLTKDAEQALYHYDFPGNARDLRNLIERACVFCDSDSIRPADLGLGPENREVPESLEQPQALTSGSLNLSDNEAAIIKTAIAKHPDNHSAAARELGISPQALYRKIEKYELK